ncbi:MAG: hypothetical protein ACPMAQ_08470 [Phycisphaerae bacterium]
MKHAVCVALRSVFLVAALLGNVAAGQHEAGRQEPVRPPSGVHEPAHVTARLVGSPRELSPAFYGFNVNLINAGASWRDPQLVRAVEDLFPGTLRYPGGTLANYWNWRTGELLQHPGAPGWSRGNPAPYRLEDLKLAVDATGARPVLVLNMLTSTLEEQLAMLRHASRLGLPVRFIELGNEFYLSDKTYIERFPTAEDYGTEATRWIDRIRKEFPEARIAAVGAHETARQAERRASWNRRLIDTLRGADAIVLHVYVGSGLGKGTRAGAAATPTRPTGPDRRRDPWYGSPEVQEQQLQALKTPEGARTVLSMPFRAVEQLKREMQELRGLGIWVTEYNLFDRIGPTKGSWAHGLLTATMLGLFLNEPRIELTCCHVIGSPITSFATIFVNEDPFRGSIVSRRVTPYAPTACGIALRAFGRAMRGMRSVRQIAFEPEPPRSTSSAVPFRPLMGWSFADGRRKRVVLLNLGDKDICLDVQALSVKGCPCEQMSASPADLVGSADDLHQIRAEAVDRLRLPSYSLTVIGEGPARESRQ